jgi:hypothetical protein
MSNLGGSKEFEEATERSQESGARIQEAVDALSQSSVLDKTILPTAFVITSRFSTARRDPLQKR